ncbi:hypothetical protein BAL199_06284 [alpha proteobacterium BAL199]|jgi:hypothetical protein|nr:hypothetical protein BAL199_06284 [alpha proteobacterium BAL199]
MINYKVLAAATIVTLALPAASIAQTAKPASMQECTRPDPSSDPAAMQGCMTNMQEMMDKARQAKTPTERQALMAEHMAMMKGQMAAMYGMKGHGGDGAMMDPKSAPQMKMMQQRMDMMQDMMKQMLDQQDLMMKPTK